MAGEAGGAMTPVFAGDIFDTFIDAQNQPEVCFRVTGRPGNYNAVKPVPPTSVQGTADAATLIGQLAKTMGYGFEGNGVSVKISNPYLHGTGMSQVRQIVEAAGLEWTIDATNTLAIWQPSQGRQGSAPLISPQTGMVSYPCVRQARIFVRSLFNPAVKFGGQIQVQSDITAACGIWQITKLDYNLENSFPAGNGSWTSWGCPTSRRRSRGRNEQPYENEGGGQMIWRIVWAFASIGILVFCLEFGRVPDVSLESPHPTKAGLSFDAGAVRISDAAHAKCWRRAEVVTSPIVMMRIGKLRSDAMSIRLAAFELNSDRLVIEHYMGWSGDVLNDPRADSQDFGFGLSLIYHGEPEGDRWLAERLKEPDANARPMGGVKLPAGEIDAFACQSSLFSGHYRQDVSERADEDGCDCRYGPVVGLQGVKDHPEPAAYPIEHRSILIPLGFLLAALSAPLAAWTMLRGLND